MIKIIEAVYLKNYEIELTFSTLEKGVVDFSYLLKKETVLTNELKNIDYFRDFYIELGSIGWKNGLELNGDSLYQNLLKSNKLNQNLLEVA